MNDTKKPVSERVGSRLTKLTMGSAFFAGRTAFRATKGLAKGAIDAGREIKAGYDEAKAEAETEAEK